MAQVPLLDTSLFSDASLQAYYQFEGDSSDSKDGYAGTDTNVTYSTGNGKFGQGVGFASGAASNISIPAILPYGDFTVTLWIKGSSLSSQEIVLNIPLGIADSIITIQSSGTGNSPIQAFINNGGGIGLPITSGNGIFDGTFHLVSYTNNTGNTNLYVDGVVQGSGSFTTGLPVDYTSYIGNLGSQPDAFAVDDVGIFTSGLTDVQISELFNGGTPPTITTDPAFILNFI